MSISEWSSTADDDITGGLVTADVLGIFGRYGVDSAQYWSTPNEMGPVGLAYWLYRGYVACAYVKKLVTENLLFNRSGTFFGSSSAQVNFANPYPDILGMYAGTENGKLTLVILNKDPSTPQAFDLANLPTGSYFIRHFGGKAGIAKYQVSRSGLNELRSRNRALNPFDSRPLSLLEPRTTSLFPLTPPFSCSKSKRICYCQKIECTLPRLNTSKLFNMEAQRKEHTRNGPPTIFRSRYLVDLRKI